MTMNRCLAMLVLGLPVFMSGRAPQVAPLVARLEVQAPPAEIESFVLRGTIPVPAAEDGASLPLTVFAMQGGARRAMPTQVETVSRYPDGDADVVEVLARVPVPPDVRPGTPLRYDVRRGASPDEALRLRVPGAVSELLESGSLELRARDVFENVYRFDLLGGETTPGFGSRRTLKDGVVARQERVYGTLVPEEDGERAGAALPHLMGVHAYLTQWRGEPFVSLDLRVNNGAIAGSGPATALEEPLGIVYWRELELCVPRGWLVAPKVGDPFWGKAYAEGDRMVFPIVEPNADGTLHMMGPQAQFHRRLVLARNGHVRRARQHLDGVGRGFCVRGEGLWSWFEPRTARYFAQRDVLASLDFFGRPKDGEESDGPGKAVVRARDWREATALERVLQAGGGGTGYATAGVMGWAHPWFIRIEGGAGGEGIAMFEGFRAAGAASAGDYKRLELLHRMNMSRQPEAMYDRFGDPVGFHAWLDEEGRIPFDFRTNGRVVVPAFRLPMSHGTPPSAQVLEVVERGLRPSYDRGNPYERGGRYPGNEDVLLAWSPHDGQHMIRYTKNTKALVWLGNDSLARDDLLLSAELFHLMWHEADHVPVKWSEGITLRMLEKTANEHPHTGLHVTRDHAWGIDSMCAAYSVASPEWRARNRDWFVRVARLLRRAAMPSGIVQRNETNTKILGHRRYAAAQGFEVLFLLHAMRCMNESVFRGVLDEEREELEQLVVRTVEYLFWGPVFRKFAPPYQPDPKNPRYVYGPLAAIPVALNDQRATPPFSDIEHWGEGYLPDDFQYKHVDTSYVWQALSYAHEITDGRGDHGAGLGNRYLSRALACGEPRESFRALLRGFYEQALSPSLDDSKNWIGFVGKLQNLGVR